MGGRLGNVQALRGLACLAVVLFHVGELEHQFGLGFAPLRPLRFAGYAGVDLFFVLSGFIIAHATRSSVGKPGEVPRYLMRRLWRVYPVYWAAVAVGATHAYLTNAEFWHALTADEVAGQLLLAPPSGAAPLIVPVAWTLSYEVAFYLAFALRVALPARVGGLLLFGWGAVVAASAAGLTGAGGDRWARLLLSPFNLEFLAGVLLARFARPLSFRISLAAVVAGIAWLVGGILLTTPGATGLIDANADRVLAFGPAAALLVLAAVGAERGGRAWNWPRLRSLGDASYSVYLTHWPVIATVLYGWIVAGWGQSRTPHLVWIAASVGGSLLAGWVFHRAVERPLMRVGSRPRNHDRESRARGWSPGFRRSWLWKRNAKRSQVPRAC